MTDPIRCYHCDRYTTNGIDGHAPDCPVPDLVRLALNLPPAKGPAVVLPFRRVGHPAADSRGSQLPEQVPPPATRGRDQSED